MPVPISEAKLYFQGHVIDAPKHVHMVFQDVLWKDPETEKFVRVEFHVELSPVGHKSGNFITSVYQGSILRGHQAMSIEDLARRIDPIIAKEE